MERKRYWSCPLLVALVAVATAARAGEVLDQVPRDALGVAIVHNLSEFDAKAGKVLGAIGSRLPGPLAFLKSMASLDAGLDTRRDLLVVLLPPETNSRQFHLAVWLPVSDYDALVQSLDGDPGRRIAAVTIAGEDLLVARQGDWAVVMDPDQRERLERLAGGTNSRPPQLDQWAEWIKSHDIAVVALPTGMQALWSAAAVNGLLDAAPAAPPAAADNDDLFGPANRPAPPVGWMAVRQWIRNTLTDVPELGRWVVETDCAAVGIRADGAGNLLASVRVALPQDATSLARADASGGPARAAARLYEGGPFVIAGSGTVSPRWAVPTVAPYLRQVSDELATHFGTRVADDELATFRRKIEEAVADVTEFSVLTRPGTGADGVFTNNFLALRVGSSQEFLQSAAELVELWNTMVAKTEGAKLLVLDATPATVAEHQGMQYSIDMLSAVGMPAIPEIKASMQKMFGPGGKFRLFFMPIDDETVLLAAATEEQVAAAIQVIAKAPAPDTPPMELGEASAMLTRQGDWRLYFSPHGYSDLMRRQLEAVLGPVIGGPVVKDFPDSPPVGFTGGVKGRLLWAEAAVPLETLRSYGKYSRK